MSSQFIRVYVPNPTTTRGTSTKIGTHGDKIIYANGRCIIIRDLKNSANDIVYSKHISATSVARFSPSGYYAASADIQGNVRIWDTVGSEQILKSEFKILSGKINDLAWDGDSQRLIAVGDGRERFGHVFMYDSGSSSGEIIGHSKPINAVAIKPDRPFRAATAGDDNTIVFFSGAPYKYEKTLKSHTNFIHTLAYAPSGKHFVSGGADHRMILWDGKSGDQSTELVDVDGKKAHSGTIFAAAWSPDSTSIITSSGDCTVKLWDVETAKATTTWRLGTGIENHQLGNTWTSSNLIISLNLAGVLNVFDPRSGDKPIRVIEAPVKSITTGTLVDQPPSFFVGSSDGKIHGLSFDESSNSDPTQCFTHVTGTGCISLLIDMTNHEQSIWSVGVDDKVREAQVGPKAVALFSSSVYSLPSQPKAITTSPSDGHTFVLGTSSIEVLRGTQKVTSMSFKYNCASIDATGSNVVAVGGEDKKIHLYFWNSNGTLTESSELPEAQKGAVTAVAFSPNGDLLAAGDSAGKIVVYDMKDRKVLISTWTHHASRIYSLAWTPDGAHIASASLDTHIYVWDVVKPLKILAIKNAIPGGAWRVAWVPNSVENGKGKLLGGGADGAVRVWEVSFH